MTKRIAIIGGGPAGMSAALWLKEYGHAPLVIEQKDRLGGQQAASPHTNTWMLGTIGKTARRVADDFAYHMDYRGINRLYQTQLTKAAKVDSGFSLSLDGDGKVRQTEVDGIIIATGVWSRGRALLDSIPGATAVVNKQRLAVGPSIFRPFGEFTGETVAIVGGGDSAFENAIAAADVAAHVHILVRNKVRAQPAMQRKAAALAEQGRLTVHINTKVINIDEAPNGLRISYTEGGSVKDLDVDYFCTLVGFTPNSGDIAETLRYGLHQPLILDKDGYILVDANQKTSIPGVYAIGDVCNPLHPCVATAVGQGTVAARAFDRDCSKE